MTANEVWTFRLGSSNKTELAGRAELKDIDPNTLPGATHVVDHQTHVLVVRFSDGFAEKCRTCDVIGLIKGQTCSFIDEYNDKMNPL